MSFDEIVDLNLTVVVVVFKFDKYIYWLETCCRAASCEVHSPGLRERSEYVLLYLHWLQRLTESYTHQGGVNKLSNFFFEATI